MNKLTPFSSDISLGLSSHFACSDREVTFFWSFEELTSFSLFAT